MENAADALKMAGSILMFVIALSVAITSFSQARATSDIVLSYSDRESSTINGNNNYYYIGNNENTQRKVGVETIIPAIYRASVENYKIKFDFNNDDYWIYKYKDKDGKEKPTNLIDSELFAQSNISISSDKDMLEFLNGIIYGVNGTEKNAFQKKYNVEINQIPLYNKIKNVSFTETLGMYYQEDLEEFKIDSIENNNKNQDDLPKKKTVKRVITYKIK